MREDAMLISDFSKIPGFKAVTEVSHFASKTFVAENNSSVRVTIIMANRLPLEEQTGADLVYYNETYRAFILVQYKALERVNNEFQFRWQNGDQFASEIDRMDKLLGELSKLPIANDPIGFRLNNNPFFLKFCNRIDFNPDDKGLFPGLYVPHGLWKALTGGDRLKGKGGGNLLTSNNVGRRLSNSEFVALVAGSWVGTTIEQSVVLEEVVRSILETGKTVTFAIKRREPPSGEGVPVTNPINIEGEAVEITKQPVAVVGA